MQLHLQIKCELRVVSQQSTSTCRSTAIFNIFKQQLTLTYQLMYEGIFLEGYAEHKVRWSGELYLRMQYNLFDSNVKPVVACFLELTSLLLPSFYSLTPWTRENSSKFSALSLPPNFGTSWSFVNNHAEKVFWLQGVTCKTPAVKLEQLSVHVDLIPFSFFH